jgi:hypothetical protein
MRFFRISLPTNPVNSLVTALVFLQGAGIFDRVLTFCIFGRHQVGFGTQHLKNDIRKYRYPGKCIRPDTTRRKRLLRRMYQRKKAVSVQCWSTTLVQVPPTRRSPEYRLLERESASLECFTMPYGAVSPRLDQKKNSIVLAWSGGTASQSLQNICQAYTG